MSEPSEAIDNLIGEAASNEKHKATHLATSNGSETPKTNGTTTEMTKNMTINTEKVKIPVKTTNQTFFLETRTKYRSDPTANGIDCQSKSSPWAIRKRHK